MQKPFMINAHYVRFSSYFPYHIREYYVFSLSDHLSSSPPCNGRRNTSLKNWALSLWRVPLSVISPSPLFPFSPLYPHPPLKYSTSSMCTLCSRSSMMHWTPLHPPPSFFLHFPFLAHPFQHFHFKMLIKNIEQSPPPLNHYVAKVTFSILKKLDKNCFRNN